MIKTDSFIKSMLNQGLVDDAITLDNGYDIQYRNNIVSVRLNDKGALIYNKNRNNIVEIQSKRLDDVLHRYIIQSLFGTQTKQGTREVTYKDVFFVPTKVIQNSVIFEDSVGRKFTVSGSTPKAVLSFYNELADVNADDCMILLNGFRFYSRPEQKIESSKDPEIELQLLKCSFSADDYSVSPKSECINDIGQTIVGNFLCSSADKIVQMTFEEDEKKLFSSNGGMMKRNINSSAIRVRNEFAVKAKSILSNSRKAVSDYVNSKYPSGLCVSSMEQMMSYEAPSILKAAGIENTISYKNLFASYLRNCDSVSFKLDSNKSILCALNTEGKSVAKFRAVPDAGAIKNALQNEGYLLSELSDGLEFGSTTNAVSSIVNSCSDFVPVSEKIMNEVNTVSRIVGGEVTEILSSYGIEDKKNVFSSVVRVKVN